MPIHQIGTFGPLLIILSFPIRVHDSLKRRSFFIDGFLDATDKPGRIVVACGRWQTIADVHQGVGKFFYDGWCGLLGQKGEHEGGVGWIHGDDDIRETLMWVAALRDADRNGALCPTTRAFSIVPKVADFLLGTLPANCSATYT